MAPEHGYPAVFVSQLSPHGYVLDARPRPVSRRTALPAATAVSASGARPCVLLLSRSRDAELDAVQELLTKADVRSARLNSDELTAVGLLIDPAGRAVLLDGRSLTPIVTWSRHFSARAIDGSGRPVHDLFLRDAWQAAASQLCAISGTAIHGQCPGVVEQLQLALRHGIAVPRTVVTTDPGRAADILKGPRYIVKTAHHHFTEAEPGLLTGVFPVIAEARELRGRPWPSPPVIVQEYVEHDAELRVYYVGGQVLGFEVSKDQPADLWLAPDRVAARRADLPPRVISATTRLAAAMRLRYGAFDFLLRAGTPVFLEVNPDGDWRWAEIMAGTAAVTAAAAKMLCDLYRGHDPDQDRGADFDLLAFLSPAGLSPAGLSPKPRRPRGDEDGQIPP